MKYTNIEERVDVTVKMGYDVHNVVGSFLFVSRDGITVVIVPRGRSTIISTSPHACHCLLVSRLHLHSKRVCDER